AFDYRASRQVLRTGPGVVRKNARADSTPDVRSRDSSRDRLQDYRARIREGAAQKRHRQVLWRRHHAKTKAAREAKGRQEADETGGARRDSAGGFPGPAQGRGVAQPWPNQLAASPRHSRKT